MLRINQLKLKVGHSEEQLKKKLVRELKIRPEELQKFEIRRQSIDARKKPELYYVYSIDVQVKKEKEVLKNNPKNVRRHRMCTIRCQNWKEKHRKSVRLL